jgi:hypothetical protein
MTLFNTCLLQFKALKNICSYPIKATFINFASNGTILRKAINQFLIIEFFVLLVETHILFNLYYVFYQNKISKKCTLVVVFLLIVLSNNGYEIYLFVYITTMIWVFVTHLVSESRPSFNNWLKTEIGDDLISFLAGPQMGSDSIKPILIILGFTVFKHIDFFINTKLVYFLALSKIEHLKKTGQGDSLNIDTLEQIYVQSETDIGPGLLAGIERYLVKAFVILKELL